jgi:hypothetical protein
MIETGILLLESGEEFPMIREQWQHFEGPPTFQCQKALLLSNSMMPTLKSLLPIYRKHALMISSN